MAHMKPLPAETHPELAEDFAIFERINSFAAQYTYMYSKSIVFCLVRIVVCKNQCFSKK